MCKQVLYVVGAVIVIAVAVVLFFPETGIAGSLEPTGVPAPTMKTLDQIPPTWSQKLSANDSTTPDGCNSSRFKCVLGGAAVLDKETGLVWERSPSTDYVTWKYANSTCYVNRKLGGRFGWRLPTVEELSSLVDTSVAGPPYLPTGHPFHILFVDYEVHYFWSATTSAIDTSGADAWVVNFYTDVVKDYPKSLDTHVLCVRGGQGYDAN
jgi:hypothetical protein